MKPQEKLNKLKQAGNGASRRPHRLKKCLKYSSDNYCETFKLSLSAKKTQRGTLKTRKQLFHELKTSEKNFFEENLFKNFKKCTAQEKPEGGPFGLVYFYENQKKIQPGTRTHAPLLYNNAFIYSKWKRRSQVLLDNL